MPPLTGVGRPVRFTPWLVWQEVPTCGEVTGELQTFRMITTQALWLWAQETVMQRLAGRSLGNRVVF